LVIGSAGAQTFTSSDPRRLRVHIDVTTINAGASFTLAYDSAANASNLSTPVLTVTDVTLILLLVALFIPVVMSMVMRRSRLRRALVTGLVTVVIILGILSRTVMPASAAPDLFYLRDTTTNGATPAGEDMNNVQGSSEDTLTFDSVDDQAYWYSDLTYPTGDDNAGIAAGSYSLNMYFDARPSTTAPQVDAVTTASTGETIIFSHTTSGSDRLMLVGVSFRNDQSETVSSITYNGDALSSVGSVPARTTLL
jgi:hypothetical protein